MTEYLAGRQEYEERTGPLQVRLSNAYRIIGGLLVVLVFLSFSIIALSGRDRVPPYVAVVDKDMNILALTHVFKGDDSLTKAVWRDQVRKWIIEARTVTPDADLQRTFILDIMARVGGEADHAIREYYTAARPDQRAKTQTVSVQVESLVPISAQSYEVHWTENVRDTGAAESNKERWTGIVTFVVQPDAPTTSADLNAIGFYVTNFNWSKI